jgi:WD40 repeat protein
MSQTSPSGGDPLPVALQLRVDAVCLRFEAAWQTGARPCIADYLVPASKPEYAHLLRELVLIDVHYRRLHGETPRPPDYQERFAAFDPAWLTSVPRSQQAAATISPGAAAAPPETSGDFATVPLAGTPLATLAIPGYEVLEELGRGGMGVVYKARQVGLNRLVALKVVLAGAHAGADELARFRREAEAVARLHHPNIIEIYEIGERDSLPYFAMEFCAGGSLAHKLGGKPLPPRQAAEVVEALAGAVQAAHAAGVIHRDLKPANVLLAEDGTPKVTDFGLAKKLEGASSLTATGAIVGTPSYMAPEQAAGEGKHVGPAADVYGLGAILYECLTGRPPFQGPTALDTLMQVVSDPPTPAGQLQPAIPAALEAICLRCLEKKPADRFGSAAEVAAALRHFLDGQPVQVRPQGSRSRWTDRKGVTILFVCMMLPGVFAFCGGIFFVPRLPEQPQFGKVSGLWALGGTRPWLARGGQKHVTVHDVHVAWQSNTFEVPAACSALAFAPHGNRLAVGTASGELVVWDVGADRRLAGFVAHKQAIVALAFSADGKALSTATKEEVRRWEIDETAGERPLSSAQVHGQLSPDGAVVLRRAGDGALEVYDAASGRKRAELGNPEGPPGLSRFSPDGRWLAAAARGGSVWLWDLTAGGEHTRLDRAAAEVRTLLFSGDGSTLGVVDGQGVTVWETSSCQPRAHLETGPLQAVALTHRGDRLFLQGEAPQRRHQTSPAARMRLVELPGGRVVHEADGYAFFALAPTGDVVLTTMRDGTARSDNGKVYSFALEGFGSPTRQKWERALGYFGLPTIVGFYGLIFVLRKRAVYRLAFSPDGCRLASVGPRQALQVWDVAGERLHLVLKEPQESRRPQRLAPVGAAVRRLAMAAQGGVQVLAFSANGQSLVTLEGDGSGQVWDLADGGRKAAFRMGNVRIFTAAMSLDGRTLATLAMDNPGPWFAQNTVGPRTLTLWDVDLAAEGVVSRRESLRIDARQARDLCFTADGRTLAAMTDAGAKLWEFGRGGLCERPLGGPSAVGALAISSDGRLVAVFSGKKVMVWDVAADRLCCELKHSTTQGKQLQRCLALSPDGRVLASGDYGDLRLWDPLTGRQLAHLRKNELGWVTALAFSPDGRLVAAGDDRGRVCWHDVEAARRAERQRPQTFQERIQQVRERSHHRPEPSIDRREDARRRRAEARQQYEEALQQLPGWLKRLLGVKPPTGGKS